MELQDRLGELREQGLGVAAISYDSEEVLADFAGRRGVTFPLLAKQEVNGQARSPLYRWLVSSRVGGGGDVSWNFEKFLVDRSGQVVGRFPSRVGPGSTELQRAIAEALAASP